MGGVSGFFPGGGFLRGGLGHRAKIVAAARLDDLAKDVAAQKRGQLAGATHRSSQVDARRQIHLVAYVYEVFSAYVSGGTRCESQVRRRTHRSGGRRPKRQAR
jgi:hypothetical protein